MPRTTSAVTILIVLTVALSLAPLPSLAVVHGDVELLKTVALQHKANFESLLTWKGEAFEEVIGKRGDEYDYMLRSRCRFAYDQLQQAVRWNKEPEESRFVVEGKSLRDINASYNSAMLKGQSSYEYSALGFRGGKEAFHLIIGELSRSRSWGIYILDPRYFFIDPAGGGPMHDRLMFLYDNAENSRLFEWYVKRVGDIVTLEVSFGENNANTEKYVFDLSVGGNVLEYYNKTPRADNVYEYKWEQQSGVWVPKSYKMMNIARREDGVLKTTRSIHWSNCVVNVPFEEDEFTLEKLGVKAGDDVHDLKIGMRYKYRGLLTDSEMLDVLDRADMPKEKNVSGNEGLNEQARGGERVTNEQDANEARKVEEGDTLQALETVSAEQETDGGRMGVYVIMVVLVTGLGGIAYILTGRLRKG